MHMPGNPGQDESRDERWSRHSTLYSNCLFAVFNNPTVLKAGQVALGAEATWRQGCGTYVSLGNPDGRRRHYVQGKAIRGNSRISVMASNGSLSSYDVWKSELHPSKRRKPSSTEDKALGASGPSDRRNSGQYLRKCCSPVSINIDDELRNPYDDLHIRNQPATAHCEPKLQPTVCNRLEPIEAAKKAALMQRNPCHPSNPWEEEGYGDDILEDHDDVYGLRFQPPNTEEAQQWFSPMDSAAINGHSVDCHVMQHKKPYPHQTVEISGLSSCKTTIPHVLGPSNLSSSPTSGVSTHFPEPSAADNPEYPQQMAVSGCAASEPSGIKKWLAKAGLCEFSQNFLQAQVNAIFFKEMKWGLSLAY